MEGFYLPFLFQKKKKMLNEDSCILINWIQNLSNNFPQPPTVAARLGRGRRQEKMLFWQVMVEDVDVVTFSMDNTSFAPSTLESKQEDELDMHLVNFCPQIVNLVVFIYPGD